MSHDSHHALPPGEEPRWLDDPANVRKIIKWFLIACAFWLALDLARAVPYWLEDEHAPANPAEYGDQKHHPESTLHSVNYFPSFYCVYGWVACVLLVLAAKVMRRVLMRPEDYYDA